MAVRINEGATPALAEGEVPIPGCNWTLFRSLPTFNIRNGDIADVRSVFIRASIAEPYHWVPINNLAPVDAVSALDGFIKSQIARFVQHPPTGTSDVQRRKMAICMGVARAVSTTFYRLTENDIIPGERAPAYLNAAKNAEGGIVYTIRPDAPENVRASLSTELALDDTEKAVVCALIKCATGIIPMQGYSLMMTNHHYLSQADTQSRRVFAVVERAYWTGQDVNTWFGADTAQIQDALWHKSCHPVMMNVKTDMAMDTSIPGKLTQCGSGACASRLPAVETELRSANSYITLLSTVAPMFGMCGGSVDSNDLVTVIDIVKSLPAGVASPQPMPNLPRGLEGVVTNRLTGLAYLSGMLRRNQDMVAYCYGFYVALSESNMMMGASGGPQGDTLKSSFSLAKLKSQSYATYITGYQAYSDYQAVRNAKRQRGEFVAPEIVIS